MTADSSPRLVRVAVFECLELADNIAQSRGQFRDVFTAWLQKAAVSYNSRRRPSEQVRIETTGWNVAQGRYPPSLNGTDAIIVSGSTASAYDQFPWIFRLAEYLKDVYTHNQHVRLFGGCFGHQLMVQTLLGDRGAFVEKSPNGWEIGVHDVALNPKFRAHFPILRDVSELSCQFLHADEAVLDESQLKDGWLRIGASRLCDVQGVYKPRKVLTFQGHPEFDDFLNEHGVRNLEKSAVLSKKQVDDSLRQIRQEDDAILHGEILIDFIVKA
ncbi:putative Glutamine amidotransferase domain-containing protein [Seiridium cardinale]